MRHSVLVPVSPAPPRRRTLLTGLVTTTLVAGSLAAGATPAPAAPAAPAADAAGIHTLRAASGAYTVSIDGVERASVPVSDRAFTVHTALSPDSARAALITDFDGRAGRDLRLLDVAGHATRTLATGPVTSAVFRPDGALGWVGVDGTDRYTLHLTALDGRDSTLARLTGTDATLLGWDSTGATAFVRTTAGAELSAPSLSQVDAATGTVRPLLTSDPAHGVVYQDLTVATVDGQTRIGAVRADSVYPCAGRSTEALLLRPDGSLVRSLPATSDSYRQVVWSADGARVAYALQGCVSVADKMTSRAAALNRLDAVNGVYLRELRTGATHRVVHGIPTSLRLDALTGTTLRFASERYGVRTVDAARPDAATATGLDAAASDIGLDAKIVGSTFIHQLWDTADTFNGNSACGPTSAVMDLAGYQLASENGYWVSSPYSHWSGYGGYITNAYSAYGTTFNAYAPDPNWNYFAGAYGWLVDDPNVGTIHAYMSDYLDRHVSYAVAQTSYLTWSWVKSKIDGNLMVVVSGSFAYGRYGHIALITGYTDDGRFYVNDPYGAGTDGSFDGKNTVYTLDYMQVKYAWAA